MSSKIRKYKIKGMPSERELASMPFGRSIEYLRAIDQFKSSCKSVHLSQKRQTYQKAIREAIDLYDVKEYYCDFYCDDYVKDDGFQFFYR